jgi:hypothetical protein
MIKAAFMAPSSFINQEKWHLHILRKYHISRKKVNKNGFEGGDYKTQAMAPGAMA